MFAPNVTDVGITSRKYQKKSYVTSVISVNDILPIKRKFCALRGGQKRLPSKNTKIIRYNSINNQIEMH